MKCYSKSQLFLFLFILVSKSIQSQVIEATKNESEVGFSFVEQMPRFPGGDTSLVKFIKKNLIYPDSARLNKIEGTVTTSFVIDDLGNLIKPTISKSLSADCDKEAIRILRIMPKWIPGRHNGKDVKVSFVLPIRFKLP